MKMQIFEKKSDFFVLKNMSSETLFVRSSGSFVKCFCEKAEENLKLIAHQGHSHVGCNSNILQQLCASLRH